MLSSRRPPPQCPNAFLQIAEKDAILKSMEGKPIYVPPVRTDFKAVPSPAGGLQQSSSAVRLRSSTTSERSRADSASSLSGRESPPLLEDLSISLSYSSSSGSGSGSGSGSEDAANAKRLMDAQCARQLRNMRVPQGTRPSSQSREFRHLSLTRVNSVERCGAAQPALCGS